MVQRLTLAKPSRVTTLALLVTLLGGCTSPAVDHKAVGTIAGIIAGGALGAMATDGNNSNQGITVLAGVAVGALVGAGIGFILDQRLDTDPTETVVNLPKMDQKTFNRFVETYETRTATTTNTTPQATTAGTTPQTTTTSTTPQATTTNATTQDSMQDSMYE